MSRVLFALLALVSGCALTAGRATTAPNHCASESFPIIDVMEVNHNQDYEVLCPFTLDSAGSMNLTGPVLKEKTCIPLYGLTMSEEKFIIAFIPA